MDCAGRSILVRIIDKSVNSTCCKVWFARPVCDHYFCFFFLFLLYLIFSICLFVFGVSSYRMKWAKIDSLGVVYASLKVLSSGGHLTESI